MTEGFYVVIDFKAETGATAEVERILKIRRSGSVSARSQG